MDDPTTYDGGVLLVLEEQLRRELDRIEERRRDLDASRELLARRSRASRSGRTEPLSEPISDAIAPSVVNRLLTETTGMLRNFVLTISEGPGTRREHDAGQRGADPARRAAARGLPRERAVARRRASAG